MAGLPVVYRKGSPIIKSYDYIDYAAGVGYVLYYGCAWTNSSGNPNYFITTQAWDCTASNQLISATAEADFDLSYTNPFYISGDAIINYTVYHGNSGTVQVTFTFYHVSAAAVETQIGQVASKTYTAGAASAYREAAKLTLTDHKFVKGEKLRVTAAVTIGGAGGGWFIYDASNRIQPTETGSGATVATSLKFLIPYKITQ